MKNKKIHKPRDPNAGTCAMTQRKQGAQVSTTQKSTKALRRSAKVSLRRSKDSEGL